MMYSFSVTHQCETFLRAIGLGITLCVAYILCDIVWGMLVSGRRRKIPADITFLLILYFFFPVFLLGYDLGKIRTYSVYGTMLGYITAYLFFGRHLLSLNERLFVFTEKHQTELKNRVRACFGKIMKKKKNQHIFLKNKRKLLKNKKKMMYNEK